MFVGDAQEGCAPPVSIYTYERGFHQQCYRCQAFERDEATR
jgi:hypothetical protein